jgi:hypothetical protein
MLKASRFFLALSFSVPAASQQIDWSKVNDEAMRNYQSLVQIDSTTTEVGVAAFVKKTLETEGIAVSIVAQSRTSECNRTDQRERVEEAAAHHGPQRHREG